MVYSDEQDLYRLDLETGESAHLVTPERATDIGPFFAVGDRVIYHVCFDSQVDIFSGPVE